MIKSKKSVVLVLIIYGLFIVLQKIKK